jgi:hypothetical protein
MNVFRGRYTPRVREEHVAWWLPFMTGHNLDFHLSDTLNVGRPRNGGQPLTVVAVIAAPAEAPLSLKAFAQQGMWMLVLGRISG